MVCMAMLQKVRSLHLRANVFLVVLALESMMSTMNEIPNEI